MRGAGLRAACPHQEPVLGPPSALARRRQAGPGRVHGVHQPGLGRAPAAAGLRGSRLQLQPLRARAVPDAPPAMVPGRSARHQRLAAGPGLRAARAATGCLPGALLRPVDDADRAVLPHPPPGLAARRPTGPRRVRRRPRRSRPGCEWIDVRCLPGRLRLEIQYVLQCRGDERQAPLRPVRVQRILRDLAATGAASLLERTEEEWAEFGPRGTRAGGGRQFVLDARARIEQLAFGSGWEVEYPRDKWRLRNLGIQAGKDVATIDFAPISQPWLAGLARRWCRWRLSAGLSASDAATRHPGDPAVLRLPGSPCSRRRSGIHRPPAAGTLPGRPVSQSRPEHPPGARLGAERVLPGHPPARLGQRRAARRRGLLPRGLPQTRPAAPPGGRRARDGPGRGPREPGPLGQPRLPAAHRHPDPLRAADQQRRQRCPGTASSPTPTAPPTCATTTPR